MRNIIKRPASQAAKQGRREAPERKDFAAKVEAMRRATGKTLTETRHLPMLCAETGKGFTLVCERQSGVNVFVLARIERHEGSAGAGAVAGKRSTETQRFNAADFWFTDYACPWCGSDATRIICTDCGNTVCGGRVRKLPNGKEFFTCHDGCGASGTLVSTDTVNGRAGDNRTGRLQKALPHKGTPRLPGAGPAGLLGWRK